MALGLYMYLFYVCMAEENIASGQYLSPFVHVACNICLSAGYCFSKLSESGCFCVWLSFSLCLVSLYFCLCLDVCIDVLSVCLSVSIQLPFVFVCFQFQHVILYVWLVIYVCHDCLFLVIYLCLCVCCLCLSVLSICHVCLCVWWVSQFFPASPVRLPVHLFFSYAGHFFHVGVLPCGDCRSVCLLAFLSLFCLSASLPVCTFVCVGAGGGGGWVGECLCLYVCVSVFLFTA